MFGLDYLISPLSAQELLMDHWGKKAVYIPGADDKFEGLYDWNAVNELLTGSRGYAGCRLLYEKKPQPPQAFNKLEYWLEKGATMVINNVNQVDPVIGKFNGVLEYELNTHVNTNSYMSYPSKQGFDNHFDRHDVFIVQTVGEKEWVVFEPTKTYPLHAQTDDSGDPPDVEPYIKCTMSPGDVLYIPRGHWHYAVAVTPSIHLTVGPEARCGAEFLIWWAKQLMNSQEFFRMDFPIGRNQVLGGEVDAAVCQGHMDEFRQKMIDTLNNPDEMNELLVRYCMLSNRRKKEHNLPNAWAKEKNLSKDTEFVIPADQKCMVYFDDDTGDATVVVRGNSAVLKGIPKQLLADILNSQNEHLVIGAELKKQYPDLKWKKIRKWLKSMQGIGLLDFPAG